VLRATLCQRRARMNTNVALDTQPGRVVPDRNQDPRITALASCVRNELKAQGFLELHAEHIFSGEGGQCVGVTGTFPIVRADILVELLQGFTNTNPPRSMAWLVNRSGGQVYLWE